MRKIVKKTLGKKRKILLGVFFFFYFLGCSPPPQKKVIFRLDGGWHMPPAFHGNPYAPGGDGTHMHFIYDRLFLMVPKTNEYIPRLALSYSLSEDRRQLRVTLRKNVLWHDEAPFTSKDVQSTTLIRYLMGWGKYLESIITPDDHTVVFAMRRPLGSIDEKILFNEKIMAPYHLFEPYVKKAKDILREERRLRMHHTKSQGDFRIKSRNMQLQKAQLMQEIYRFRPSVPIGTGAFKFSFVSASDLGLVKFEKGLNAEAISIDEVRIVKSASNDLTWAYLIGGEIDAAHPATSQDVTERILHLNPKTKLLLPSDYTEFGFIFNTQKEPLSDLHLRKAIAYATQKDIIRMISNYYSTTAGPYNTGVLYSMRDSFLDQKVYSLMTAYQYNLKKAHEILAGAGYWKDGEGFYQTPIGDPIQIEIATMAGYSDWVLGCESLSSQLKTLGIRSYIKTYEPSLFHRLLRTRQFDMAANFGADYKGYAHPAPSFARYFGKGGYIKVAGGLPDRMKSYHNRVIDFTRALDVLRNSNDQKEIRETITHLAWIANEYLPFLTIYEKNLMVFVVDGKRITGWPDGNDPIWSASSAGLESVFSYLISSARVKGIRREIFK